MRNCCKLHILADYLGGVFRMWYERKKKFRGKERVKNELLDKISSEDLK